MKNKLTTHRVVTFLTRDELDFLDKLEKDIMFSAGKYISRSQIIQDMAELLSRTHMNAKGIKDNDELKQRILEAMAKVEQRYQEHTEGPDA